MNKCPICLDGRLVTKTSSAGEESYCKDCRRIVKSATLDFFFAAHGEQGVTECKGPADDPRPGFKGPGEKARCYLYEPGDDDAKRKAEEKARNSAYSTQHRRASARFAKKILGVSYFEGAPDYVKVNNIEENDDFAKPLKSVEAMVPTVNAPTPSSPVPAAAAGSMKGVPQSAANAANAVTPGMPMPPISSQGMMAAPTTPATAAPVANMPKMMSKSDPFNKDTQSLIPGADDVQPGELNGANPLNSGTTASKKLAELVKEISGDPVEITTYMGPGFCTEHNKFDGCKQ